MSAATFFRDVISTRRRGWMASLLRGAFGLCALPYGWAVRRRNAGFDAGRRVVERVPARLISVGNLTVGGTGKTPFVAWLARWLIGQGVPVAIVSRGYGARSEAGNDEARELARVLPDVPHIQNPDRVAAAREAAQAYGAQVIIADDAFQHRRLHRDLEIVLLDALEPFGYEHLLPRGLLREPIDGLRRAHVVALTRSDLLTPSERLAVRDRVLRLAPDVLWLEVSHRPTVLRSADGQQRPVEELARGRWLGFCGIGNPDGFRRTLEVVGTSLAGWREFPDHCPYAAADLVALGRWAESHPDATAAICTGKDLVKISHDRLGRLPLWALMIELSIEAGEAQLIGRLRDLIGEPGIRRAGEVSPRISESNDDSTK